MRFLHLFILLTSAMTSTYAYLDPGSGSMLLYALLGVLATLLYSLKNLYYKIILWILGKKNREHTGIEEAKIVFHSEGKKHWNIFAPVIHALDAHKVHYAYVTHDKEDPVLAHQSEFLHCKFFSSEMQAILFMNQLHAPMVMSTTPQLDVYMMTRSKHVKHYAHLIHAPTDVLIYKKFAFDFYDSVFCSGSHQIEHLRMLEHHRGTKPKLLLETGCTYYDVLNIQNTTISHNQNSQQEHAEHPSPTILFAPTWGAASAITHYGFQIFQQLLNTDFNIIFRPHPQLAVSQPELINPILAQLRSHSKVHIDTSKDASVSMATANILVSDISGIIFDFAFLYHKPIVLVDTKISEQGYEADGIIDYREIWEYKIRSEIARVVKEKEINTLSTVIINSMKKDTEMNETSTTNASKEYNTYDSLSLKEKYVYNFGKAGTLAATQILDILHSIETSTC